MMKQNITVPALTISLVLCLAIFAFADKNNNRRALHNISEAKAYFDVNIGIPEKLVARLKLIDVTYDQLSAAGAHPEFVIGFRGKASRFVTKGNDYIFEEDIATKREIHAWIKRFKDRGIPMEQCLISVGFQNIDPTDILPEIELVQNGYISMIGYQIKGYAQVPID